LGHSRKSSAKRKEEKYHRQKTDGKRLHVTRGSIFSRKGVKGVGVQLGKPEAREKVHRKGMKGKERKTKRTLANPRRIDHATGILEKVLTERMWMGACMWRGMMRRKREEACKSSAGCEWDRVGRPT